MTTTATHDVPPFLLPFDPAAAALVAETAAVLSMPRTAAVDSFLLHAPLELLARVGLLALLPRTARPAALERVEALRDGYAAAGEPVPLPAPLAGRPEDVAVALQWAVRVGDTATVDAAAAALLPTWQPADAAAALAGTVVPSLAAAGHTPIGLYLLARLDTGLSPMLLRPTLQRVASRPEWRLTWFEHAPVEPGAHAAHDAPVAPTTPTAGLLAALGAAPHLGRPGSDFIHPLMSQAEDSGHVARLLGPLLADPGAAPARVLARVAAWSMLHDDATQAPYGWSHALTIPQAVMALAGRGVSARVAFAVAGTHLLGFRMAHGLQPLPAVIEPGRAPDTTWRELAAAASAHPDAHLVKYTLAAFHAALDDPEYAPLYLAAAHHLGRWWVAHDAQQL